VQVEHSVQPYGQLADAGERLVEGGSATSVAPSPRPLVAVRISPPRTPFGTLPVDPTDARPVATASRAVRWTAVGRRCGRCGVPPWRRCGPPGDRLSGRTRPLGMTCEDAVHSRWTARSQPQQPPPQQPPLGAPAGAGTASADCHRGEHPARLGVSSGTGRRSRRLVEPTTDLEQHVAGPAAVVVGGHGLTLRDDAALARPGRFGAARGQVRRPSRPEPELDNDNRSQ
jgi:hypothetical protein